MPRKPSPNNTPETKPVSTATYRELTGSSYIVLQDGTLARKLKPRFAGQTRYWFLSHEGRLKCLSQKTIDEMTTFP
jgi:hypothetical protein